MERGEVLRALSYASSSSSSSSSSSDHDSGDTGGDHSSACKTELVIAWLLLFAVIFNMLLIYLLNWRNPYIRLMTSRMLCMALSVYCAVLFNQALFSFIFEELLQGHASAHQQMCVGFLVFVCLHLLLHLFCWFFRKDQHSLGAAQHIGAHVTAFAGITAFANMQQSEKFHDWLYGRLPGDWVSQRSHVPVYLLVILVATMCFYVQFGVAWLVRRQCYFERTDGYDSLARDLNRDRGGWLDSMTEAEADAGALVKGFLLLQLATLLATGKEPEISKIHGSKELDEHHSIQQAALLLAVGVGLLALLLLATYIKVACSQATTTTFQGHASIPASILNLRGTLCMAMAWVFQRAGDWFLYREGLSLTLEMARVCSAFIMSVFAFVWILIINAVADSTQERKQRLKLAEDNADIRSVVSTTPAPLSADTVFEQALQNVINGFAVLVALSWDKAFESAEHIMVHGSSGMISAHPVIFQGILAVVLILLVLPGWTWHVVPAAQKDWLHHWKNIRLQQRRGLSRVD